MCCARKESLTATKCLRMLYKVICLVLHLPAVSISGILYDIAVVHGASPTH